MKYVLRVLLIIVLCGLISCVNKSTPSSFYTSVDSLLEVRPDSALALLQSFSNSEIESMSSSKQAEYALLLTQAMDKNFIPQASDSLIMVAVNYYKNKDKVLQKTKSYYYLGRIYQDIDDDTSAAEAFLTALDFVDENGEAKLHAYININLASCYFRQDLYLRAMERYKKAYAIGSKLGDTPGVFYPLRGMGDVYLMQDKPDSTLYYYQEAFTVANNDRDSVLAAVSLCDIAHFYNQHEDYELANEYISRAINMSPDTDFSYYYLKGNVLSHLNDHDSAYYYLQKSLDINNLYTYVASNYALYNLEKSVKNYQNAIQYADDYIVYYDSIQHFNQRAEITKLMNDHALESHKKEVDARQQRFMLYWVIAFLVFLSVSVYVFFLIDRRKKGKLINLQQELMQNRSKLAQLQNVLVKSTSELKIERQESEQAQLALQERQKELCMRLFQTTSAYKIVQDFDSYRRQKKEPKELTDKDRDKVQKSIDEIYIDFIQQHQQAFPQLSQGDIYCCTLSYMGFSNLLVGYLMGVDPNVVTQRRYRIKGKMDESAFNLIFSSSGGSK